MKNFTIGKDLVVVCQSQNTRYGFRHLATLLDGGRELESAKACYYNRTWESYEFESVLESLCEKAEKAGSLSKYHQAKFKRLIKNNWQKDAHKQVENEFKSVAMIAKMGEIFGSTQKESNDWKARMLKAGLESKGLTMPADWDLLSEDEKQSRLDKVLSVISK